MIFGDVRTSTTPHPPVQPPHTRIVPRTPQPHMYKLDRKFSFEIHITLIEIPKLPVW